MDQARVIGINNSIPWKIPGEQKYFAQKTKGHTVLMGRKTFESLPERYRPLPERLNIVVTRSPESQPDYPDTRYVSDPIKFIEACRASKENIQGDILWVIGGEQLYTLTAPLWDELYLTEVFGTHDGDAYFPDILNDFECVSEDKHQTHRYLRLCRRNGA